MKKKIKEFKVDKKAGKRVAILIPPSRNSATLASFAYYCKEYPQQRFWQALRNWSESGFILADGKDTYWREGRKDQNDRCKYTNK